MARAEKDIGIRLLQGTHPESHSKIQNVFYFKKSASFYSKE